MSAHPFATTRCLKLVKKRYFELFLRYNWHDSTLFFVRVVRAHVVELELDFYTSKHLFERNHNFWDRSKR